MQALIVKEDKVLRSKLAFLLGAELKIDVKEAGSLQEGLALLLDDTNKFSLMICDDNAENVKLFKYLMTSDIPVKCLVIKDPKTPSVLAFPDLIAGYVNPAQLTEDIKALFADKVNQAKAPPKEGEDAHYCQIPASLLMKEYPLFADIYLRLSSQKYVKIFNKGDNFTGKNMDLYLEQKKYKSLSLKNEEAAVFTLRLRKEMERALKTVTDPVEAGKAATSVQETVAELGNRLGFTPEVMGLAKQGIFMTIKSIGPNPSQLNKIVKNILADKERYLGNHAIVTAQVACSLAALMEWHSETTYQKLTFAAFFHDIILQNNSLAKVLDLNELEQKVADFTADEVKRYKLHTAACAQIAANFKEVPSDVHLIISQHHEKPDGKGFPRGLTEKQLAPLAMVFIIAHDVVHHVFDHGPASLEGFLKAYKEKYSIGRFGKILAKLSAAELGL